MIKRKYKEGYGKYDKSFTKNSANVVPITHMGIQSIGIMPVATKEQKSVRLKRVPMRCKCEMYGASSGVT